MEIYFNTKKLAKEFSNGSKLIQKRGSQQAILIMRRLTALQAAKNLMDFWPPKTGPERCHEISQGKKKIALSMDLDFPYRLIFVPYHDPLPLSDGEGLDWSQVTAIKIMGVENTHGKGK